MVYLGSIELSRGNLAIAAADVACQKCELSGMRLGEIYSYKSTWILLFFFLKPIKTHNASIDKKGIISSGHTDFARVYNISRF